MRLGSRHAALLTLWPLGVAVGFYLALISVYLWRTGGNFTFFVHFSAGSLVSEVFGGAAAGLWVHAGGHDGAGYYAIAQDPFHPDRLQNVVPGPMRRYKRILYPLLVHSVAFGQPGLIAPGLLAVNVAALLVGGYFLQRLTTPYGLAPVWSLLYFFHPGMVLSVLYDLPTSVAAAGVIGGLLAAQRARWGWAAVGFVVGLFTWEVLALPTYVGVLGYHCWRTRRAGGRFPRVLFFPLVSYGLWIISLHVLFPNEVFTDEIGNNFGYAGVGWWLSFRRLFQEPVMVGWWFQLTFLLLMLLSLGYVGWRLLRHPDFWAAVSFPHVLMAVVLNAPNNLYFPTEFPRKSVGLWLGVLMLFAAFRDRFARWLLFGVGFSVLLLWPWLPPLPAA